AFMTFVAGKVEERDAKLDRWCDFIAAKEARAELLRAEAKLYTEKAKQLKELADTHEAEAKRSKAWLTQIFLSKGWGKIETTYHRVWTQVFGGPKLGYRTSEPEAL